jgi:hypothetical protein
MKMKRKATATAFIFVSGILAYLALAIVFWQSAMAAPLESKQDKLPFDSVGAMYAYHNSDVPGERMVAIAYTHGAIMGAVTARALAECTDSTGDADYSCISHRREAFITYIANVVKNSNGSATNENLVKTFFNYCVNMEADEVVEVGFIAALFLSTVVEANERSQ